MGSPVQIDIVIATHNLDKFKEITSILDIFPVQAGSELNFLGLGGIRLPEEKGKTLEENAIGKAEFVARITNKIVIADDTGLEVDSLNGLPGVYSARFAGKGASYKANRSKLLLLLASHTNKERKAKFKCVAAVAGIPGESTKVFEGELDGYITQEERGSFGFGYDSIFLVPELDKTLAELPPEIKNQISHRARALLKVKEYLAEKALRIKS